jgi:hypothetical protein
LPQNQWEQFAWHGIRKRSWQTEQTSSSGGTADAAAEEEELISSPPGFRSPCPRRGRNALGAARVVLCPPRQVVGRRRPATCRLGCFAQPLCEVLSVVGYEATTTPTLSNPPRACYFTTFAKKKKNQLVFTGNCRNRKKSKRGLILRQPD